MSRISNRLLLVAILTLAMAPAFAQNLNWYGQTGALSTPLAYVTASPSNSVGAPTVAFHMGAAGDVIGFQSQFSITAGAFKRVEFGLSHTLTSDASLGGGLFENDFFTVHAKVNVLPENFHKTFLPAVSVGFMHTVAGCALGTSIQPAPALGWKRVHFDVTNPAQANPPINPTSTVKSMAIVLDEGPDAAANHSGVVVLDNIDVNGKLIERGVNLSQHEN